MEKADIIAKLAKEVYLVNKGNNDVWFEFSGHVNMVQIRAAIGGWEKTKNTPYQRYSWVNDDDFEAWAEQIIKELQSL